MKYTAKDIREHQKAMQEMDAKAREKAASDAAEIIVNVPSPNLKMEMENDV